MLWLGLLLVSIANAATPLAKQPAGEPKTTQPASTLAASVSDTALALPSITSMNMLDDKLPLNVGEAFAYTVLEDNEEPIALYVDTQGMVTIPLLGKRKAEGITPKAFAKQLKSELEKEMYYTATVIVDRSLASKGKVFISGQVITTGSMELPPSQVWTLSKTILSSGGFTDAADRARVAIIRKDPANPKAENRQEYDVGKMLETGNFSADPIVRPGDLVLVSRIDMSARFTVTGQVATPGVYNINRSDFTVSQAVLSAGGATRFANVRRVKLIRTKQGGERETIYVDLKKVLEEGRLDLDPVVLPNDTINVSERLINF